MEYKNPILTGFYPDPSICRVLNDYYMVNSSFEYLPGIPVFHSKDLIHWEQIGHCLTRESQMEFPNAKCSGGIYAAAIRYHEGTFYVISTNTSKTGGGSGNFYVTAKDPYGEWSDPIWVSQDGIDPSLFFDEDGTVYFTSNGQESVPDKPHDISLIQQAEIDIKTGKLLTESRVISYGSGGRCVEGPHLYKKDGMYYLLLAEGGTALGHMVTVSRSASPWGPFELCPDNPILTTRDENLPELYGTGHADLVETAEGDYWMVFLCYRIAKGKYHHLGRETAIMPLDWDKNGWPKVKGGKIPPIKVKCEDRLLPEFKGKEPELNVRFDGSELGFEWNFIRKYYKNYSLKEKPGNLVLYGTKVTLSDNDTPAFIGRRQCHFNLRCEVKMDFSAESENEEAGIAVLCSSASHYDLGVSLRNRQRIVVLKKKVEDMETEVYSKPIAEGDIRLFIRADRELYQLGYIDDDREIVLGSGLAKMLSTEVIWGFTGVYIGMYVTGNGKEVRNPAVFRYFNYQPLGE